MRTHPMGTKTQPLFEFVLACSALPTNSVQMRTELSPSKNKTDKVHDDTIGRNVETMHANAHKTLRSLKDLLHDLHDMTPSPTPLSHHMPPSPETLLMRTSAEKHAAKQAVLSSEVQSVCTYAYKLHEELRAARSELAAMTTRATKLQVC